MMTWPEHVAQAELLLRDAEEALETARGQAEYRRVKQMVQMAHAHAMVAMVQKGL